MVRPVISTSPNTVRPAPAAIDPIPSCPVIVAIPEALIFLVLRSIPKAPPLPPLILTPPTKRLLSTKTSAPLKVVIPVNVEAPETFTCLECNVSNIVTPKPVVSKRLVLS